MLSDVSITETLFEVQFRCYYCGSNFTWGSNSFFSVYML